MWRRAAILRSAAASCMEDAGHRDCNGEWSMRFVRLRRSYRLGVVGVAATYVVLAVWLGLQGASLGARTFGVALSPMSSASATALLSALATGMIAFTGIVFSLAFVALQFGTTAYGPRIVAELQRTRLAAHAVGLFTGTFLYALMAIRTVDLGGAPGINAPVVGVAMIWLLASVIMSIAILPRVASLSIGQVLAGLGRHGREAAARVYPPADAGASPARVGTSATDDAFVRQIVAHEGDPRYILGLDVRGLVAEAEAVGGVVEIPHAIGEAVIPGERIAVVRGAHSLVADVRLRKAVWLGIQREIDNDPAFALRLLVDAAIRALSPAVNDPTTAVEALHQIHALLREIGRGQLDIGRVADRRGRVRLVFAAPTWEELVSLALSEIHQYGRESGQVKERLRDLVQGLMAELPAERHAALRRFARS